MHGQIVFISLQNKFSVFNVMAGKDIKKHWKNRNLFCSFIAKVGLLFEFYQIETYFIGIVKKGGECQKHEKNF